MCRLEVLHRRAPRYLKLPVPVALLTPHPHCLSLSHQRDGRLYGRRYGRRYGQQRSVKKGSCEQRRELTCEDPRPVSMLNFQVWARGVGVTIGAMVWS